MIPWPSRSLAGSSARRDDLELVDRQVVGGVLVRTYDRAGPR